MNEFNVGDLVLTYANPDRADTAVMGMIIYIGNRGIGSKQVKSYLVEWLLNTRSFLDNPLQMRYPKREIRVLRQNYLDYRNKNI